MSKFEKGDKVVVNELKDWQSKQSTYQNFVGKVGTVYGVYEPSVVYGICEPIISVVFDGCKSKNKNGGYYFDPSHLELVPNKYNCSKVLANPYTVEKVETFNNKVVLVTFKDGSQSKSVCKDGDTFSLEQGISICITKQLLGGTKAYNNKVNKAIKLYYKDIANKKREEEKNIAEKARLANKRKKDDEKRKQRKEKRDAELVEMMRKANLDG